MSKPNAFGFFADLLEKANPDSMSPVVLAFCIVGFWIFTGSFFAALALTLLLAGCATTLPTTAAVCPTFPSKPAARTPMPDSGYLESARADIERWQSALKAISTTGKP